MFGGCYNRNGTAVTMLIALTSNKPFHMSILTQVPSEGKIKALIRQLSFKKRLRCPRCGSTKIYKSECRYRCPKCRKPFSIKSVSWLSGMKLSYQQMWILLACWQTKKSLSTACELADVSIPTARRWYRRFQYRLPYKHRQFLVGGVEVDEAFVGKRKTGNQRIVLGAYERSSGHIALKVTTNRTQETTDRFILKHIDKTSTVYTDAWGGYEGIDEFFGYDHETCNHSKYIFGPTNHIEAVWSSLKRFIRRTYQYIRAYWLPQLVREFEARHNEPNLFLSPQNYLAESLSCSISFT